MASEIQGEDSSGAGSVRFVVCPGKVRSANDGDYHYIGVGALVRLYELQPGEWISWDRRYGYDTSQMTFLGPSHTGNYGRPS